MSNELEVVRRVINEHHTVSKPPRPSRRGHPSFAG